MPIFGHHSDIESEQSLTAAASYDHQIALVDRTRQDDDNGGVQSVHDNGNQSLPGLPGAPISQKSTRQSLREELARRRYARWQEDRSADTGQPESSASAGQYEGADRPSDTSAPEPGKGRDTSRLQRGKQRVHGTWHRNKASPRPADTGAEIDILYENQRGAFFFGIPLFSRQSLLNFDPAPWLTRALRPSPVDITNAQVPDPSWEWAWRSWYVDMSHDVDEEGWQYSFSFQRGFSWHGTHPWFHSFVRRRRWLRKRVRRRGHAGQNGQEARALHMLNADYFTIHSRRDRSPTSRPASTVGSGFGARAEDEHPEPAHEMRDIPTLMAALRKAAIDREKVVAVRRFIDQGGEELYYLADQMPTIMSLLIFQSSRRQLLALLLHTFDASTSASSPTSSPTHRRAANLLKAARAADGQVRRLEYWSDIRDMAREGETLGAADDDDDDDDGLAWGPEWQGIDTSGPGSGNAATPTRAVGEEEGEGGESEGEGAKPEPAPDEERGRGDAEEPGGGEAGRESPGHADGGRGRPDKGKGRAE